MSDASSPMVFWYALDTAGWIVSQGLSLVDDVYIAQHPGLRVFETDQNMNGQTHRYDQASAAFVPLTAEERAYVVDGATGLRGPPPPEGV